MRCFGKEGTPLAHYHDTEWGVPSHDDQHLFEMLCLEGMQAGLSWELILAKRAAYRAAFHDFGPVKVAKMTDITPLLDNPGLIRHELKLASIPRNARAFLEIQAEFGTFSDYLWAWVDRKPIVSRHKHWDDIPCLSPLSEALAKDLKKRGMTFVGPKIIYSYMQAVGLLDDHLIDCPIKARGSCGGSCRSPAPGERSHR